MKRLVAVFVLFAAPLLAEEPGKMTIAAEPLGDAADGVVVRTTFRFGIGPDVPPGVPLVIQGSVTQNGAVTKRFRLPLQESQRESLTTIQTLQPGDAEIEARLMVPLEESAPVIVAKATQRVTIARTNKTYVAGEGAGAEAMIAEGVVSENAGAVKIVAPRRDVALNYFIVDVDAQPPVKRVEFWVEGKKVITKNEPPYRAELDLGKLPKRVEVRAVGYDEHGRYIDADAFVVNERETPLEVKITRTVTPDNVSHFKLSVQNPRGNEIKSVTLFAGQKKIFEWSHPPYAISIPSAKLNGVDFVRASAVDSTNYEASDLLFLNGDHFSEEIEVNVVELPVSVADAAGAPVADLKQSDFTVLENGKPHAITAFNFAQNLPISVGLLIDHSGSMEKRMEATKKAAAEFLKRIIRTDDRAFVGGFAFDPQKVAPFVTDVGSLEAQVEAIPKAAGGTSLYDAIVTGLYRFRGLQGRKALIILTDGEDTTSRVTYEDLLTYARAARVPLYFIGVGIRQIPGFGGSGVMKSMAAETGGTAYFIHSEKQMGETYVQLEKDLRSQYLIAYKTESTRKDRSYRTVEVKVGKPGLTARTIRGYIP
ncbi:MAG TPA: VWA domain-containing protein [Thermoanaerobaculia bacterium]|nr:VWA domain-containing protein [Thermoanaerobaculia bacterium]